MTKFPLFLLPQVASVLCWPRLWTYEKLHGVSCLPGAKTCAEEAVGSERNADVESPARESSAQISGKLQRRFCGPGFQEETL